MGKQYNANSIHERCNTVSSPVAAMKGRKAPDEEKNQSKKQVKVQPMQKEKSVADSNLLETLMNPKEGFDYVLWQLKKQNERSEREFQDNIFFL